MKTFKYDLDYLDKKDNRKTTFGVVKADNKEEAAEKIKKSYDIKEILMIDVWLSEQR